jgi:hypothetical protein
MIKKTVKFSGKISWLNTNLKEVRAFKINTLGLNPNLPWRFANPGTTGYVSIHLIV